MKLPYRETPACGRDASLPGSPSPTSRSEPDMGEDWVFKTALLYKTWRRMSNPVEEISEKIPKSLIMRERIVSFQSSLEEKFIPPQ